ncbi:MAG: hypothetical protein ATN36_07490 [Epulopiscium sp. Nele67-Bin005]|nr:MAG: hypothetical protein ATN36_07490 [Epulopiscium sp. Nele67-Bin005]
MRNYRFHEIKCNDKNIIFDRDTSQIYVGTLKENNWKISEKENGDKINQSKFLLNPEYNTLIISCAETCNLSCKYCFANEGTYNSSKNLIMNDKMYGQLLDKLLVKNEPLKSISLFGGEPLLGFKYIKNFIKKLQEGYLAKDWPLPLIGIVTNGTLITKEIGDFFQEYNIAVTISLDGSKEFNDLNRKYPNSTKSVYDKIVSNISNIRNRTFPLVAAATISTDIIKQYQKGDYKKYLEHYQSLGFDYVEHFIADSPIPLTTEEITKIELYAIDKVEVVFDNLVNNNLYVPYGVIGVLSTIVQKKYSPECGAGLTQMFYSAENEFYPCQTYYAVKEKHRNTLYRTEIINCQECFCVNICCAYCSGSSLLFNGNESSVIERRCVYQKALTEAIIKNLYIYTNDKDYRIKIVKNLKKLANTNFNRIAR